MPEYQKTNGLALLMPAERELVERIHEMEGHAAETSFLELAALRLRNMLEKYSDEYKRDARKRATADDGVPPESYRKLEICRSALETCRARLASDREA